MAALGLDTEGRTRLAGLGVEGPPSEGERDHHHSLNEVRSGDQVGAPQDRDLDRRERGKHWPSDVPSGPRSEHLLRIIGLEPGCTKSRLTPKAVRDPFHESSEQ